MLSRYSRHLATGVALLIGVVGVLGLLYAWRLPPFQTTIEVTEDAYVRGQVTGLAPQLAGVVAEVAVQDYQHVSKGQLLVRIDDAIFRQRLAQAEAELAVRAADLDNALQSRRAAQAAVRSAEAKRDSAKAALVLAQSTLKRTDRLVVRKVVSQSDADQTRLARDQAQAALDQAKAEVESARQDLVSVITNRKSLEAEVETAKAGVALARIDLDHTRILSPVDGKLGAVSARLGQYVSAGATLMTLVPDQIWVVANFKETQLNGMKIGQPVTFTVDALDDAELTGTIERFSPATGSEFSVISANNATGNFIKISQRLPLRIAIDPNQPLADRLAPGLSVVARIDTASTAPSRSAADSGRTSIALATGSAARR